MLKILVAVTVSALLLLSAACHHAMPVDEAIATLQSPSASERQSAADSLRTPMGVPPAAIQPLLAAASTAPPPAARGAELIALGKSGSPAAKPLIDQAVMTAADPDSRRWAGRALRYWLIATGQLPADPALPPGWPYGQPGYPPILAK